MIQADRRSLVLLLGGNVLFAAGLVVHAFLFNFYLRELNLPATVMGHQVAAMTLGGLCALLPAGAIIDRFGTRVNLLAGVGATVAGLALTALARDRATIYAAAVVTGAGAAMTRVAWGPAIMRLADPRNRARIFTWNVSLLIGSGAAWTFVAGAARDHRLPHVATLTPTQLVLLAGALTTALAAACYAGVSAPIATRSTRRRDVTLPADGGLRVLVPLVALWMIAAALVLPFFNVYFVDRYGLSIAKLGFMFGSTHIVTAVVLVAAAEAARRWGPRRMLFGWMCALAPALLVLAFGGSLWLAVSAYVVQGLVGPATNPLIDQLLLEVAPKDRQGIVSGWRNVAAESAGVLGAAAGGRLLDAVSFAPLFELAAALAAASALLLSAALRVSHASLLVKGADAVDAA